MTCYTFKNRVCSSFLRLVKPATTSPLHLFHFKNSDPAPIKSDLLTFFNNVDLMKLPNPTLYERQMIEKLPEYSRRENQAIGYTLWWFSHIGINLDSIIQAIPVERLH